MENNEVMARRGFGELSGIAWRALKGHWRAAIGTSCLALGIQMGAGMLPVFGRFAGILLSPLTAGMMLFWLKLIRGEKLELAVAFEPFSRYWRFLWGSVRPFIFVLLWTLLFIVPGIVASCRYSMTLYIMLDDPDIEVEDAMAGSSRIIYGHKLRFFGYCLLLGLMILAVAILTLGIGLIWLVPWAGAFMAAFYESIPPPRRTRACRFSARGRRKNL
jgi:uncharacterized membrane protein